MSAIESKYKAKINIGRFYQVLGILIMFAIIPWMRLVSFYVNDRALIQGGIMALIVSGQLVFRHGKRYLQQSADQILETDQRSPILLLRAFRMDNILIDRPKKLFFTRLRLRRDLIVPITFEEALTEVLQTAGPVIAIGRPGESLPPLGASRTYVSDNEWQIKVHDLAASSSYLVIIMDKTDGVQWEIEHIVPLFSKRKVLIVFPPTHFYTDLMQINTMLYKLGIDINIDNELVAIAFDDKGKLIKISSKSNSMRKRLKLIADYLD